VAIIQLRISAQIVGEVRTKPKYQIRVRQVRGIEALQMAKPDMDMGAACFMRKSALIY